MPQITQAVSTAALASDQEAQTELYRVQIQSLKAAKPQQSQLLAELEELRSSIPAGVESTDFLRELAELEAATGAKVTALGFSDPTAAAATAPAETTDVPADPAEVAPDAVPTTSGAVTVPVTLTVSGSLDAVVAYVRQLQEGERLFLFSKVELTEGETATAIVTGSIFALPLA